MMSEVGAGSVFVTSRTYLSAQPSFDVSWGRVYRLELVFIRSLH